MKGPDANAIYAHVFPGWEKAAAGMAKKEDAVSFNAILQASATIMAACVIAEAILKGFEEG